MTTTYGSVWRTASKQPCSSSIGGGGREAVRTLIVGLKFIRKPSGVLLRDRTRVHGVNGTNSFVHIVLVVSSM